tara:strand:+ start:312 stop:716 length:405 start_codon:yes stop_codon:yes gene_type:complete
MITTHSALIYAMVLSAAADGNVDDEELETISEIINVLPIFHEFEIGNFGEIAGSCIDMLSETDGLDAAVDQIKRTLPDKLGATAYALACDVVAADGTATQEELRFLEILRHELDVDRLTAAAIERGSAARYARP